MGGDTSPHSETKKMPDVNYPSGIFSRYTTKTELCVTVISLSLGFFRFQSLHGISEIPKNFSLSRRPKSTPERIRG
jgi:hypothetical protein